MKKIDLAFRPAPRRTCRVRLGAGALDALVRDLTASPVAPRLVVVADSNVMPLYGAPLAGRFTAAGLNVNTLAFPAGEASKTRETKQRLEDELFAIGATREIALVAVGGGVTGDLAGFVAATWHRGVPLIQVPTSLLAMVDAAVGGKTAVNLPGGKNLVGSFRQPHGIYADPELLTTLPQAEYTEGLAEVVKSGVIADLTLFRWLEREASRLIARETEAVGYAVERCVRLKARVVRRDELESGRRAMLNFGHTVGHALEVCTRFRVRHGAAVAVGSAVEARIAERRTGFPAAHVRRIEALLRGLGLPTRLPPDCEPAALVQACHRDKKVRAGEVRASLPLRLGKMPSGGDVTVAVSDDALHDALVAVGSE